MMVEDRRPEVPEPPGRADENVGTHEADNRHVLSDELLHPIVQALAESGFTRRQLTAHQRATVVRNNGSFPFAVR